jgi:hypothetical protein
VVAQLFLDLLNHILSQEIILREIVGTSMAVIFPLMLAVLVVEDITPMLAPV